MRNLSFTVHLFREGDTYVAHVPELDVSSCGETQEKARANIQDAVRGFLEAAEDKGTLDEILEEAGYQRQGGEWKAPEFVGAERVTMRL
jgi:predicted RNase H-like HicB family nuclease